MPTFGLAFLAIGALLMRQVAVGRTRETPSDIKALTLAILSGDAAAMQTVMSQRGTNADVESVSEVATSTDSTSVSTSGSASGSTLLSAAMVLGNSASGYVWGATGPKYYDCSGLVWQACRKLKIYNGARFTTSTFEAVAKSFATKVSTPAVGDIVVWPGKHMGIVSGADSYYSARSVSKGIGTSSLSDDVAYFAGNTPQYWRVK